jgi:hypothetical protein
LIEFAESFSGDFDIGFPRLLRFLYEGVQHVDCVVATRQIDHAVLVFGVHSNLYDSGTDDWHWLPIPWLQSLLDTLQLVADVLTGRLRKRSNLIERVAMPNDCRRRGFHELIIRLFV